MKALITILSVFLFGSIQSQIVVDRSFMPKAGDKVHYTIAQNTSAKTYELKGAGITWDYSSLKLAFQEPEEYKSARSINFFFFSLDYGVKVADSIGFGQFLIKDIYDVYDVSNNSLRASGRSISYNGFPIPQNYQDKDEVYQFPLAFGDMDTSTFKVSFSLGGQLNLVQQGTRINSVEGWGDLILPNKTYSNCIKVRSFIDEVDSLKFSGVQLPPFPNRRIEYKWFAQGVTNPVLVVSGSLIGNNFTVTSTRFQESEREIIGFYPTNNEPFVDEMLKVNDTSSMTGIFRTWEITPNTYKLMGGSNLGDSSMAISFDEPGFYSVKLTKRNRYGSRELTKSDCIEVKKKEVSTLAVSQTADPENKINVFPNPFVDYISVENAHIDAVLKLIDASGCVVRSVQGSKMTDLSDLNLGLYLLQVESQEKYSTIRLVKN